MHHETFDCRFWRLGKSEQFAEISGESADFSLHVISVLCLSRRSN